MYSTWTVYMYSSVSCGVRVALGFLVLGFTSMAGAPSDSTTQDITLRYRLNVGDKYLYRVVTDQVVVNGYSARLQSMFQIEAISKDRYNNTRCRLRITSDNSKSLLPMHRTPAGSARFAGYRLWSQAGAYDAVMDALGRIVTGKVVSNDIVGDDDGTGTTEPTQDMLSVSQRPDNMPEVAAMMVPNSMRSASIHRGELWRDTILSNSKASRIETTRLGESNEAAVLLDTIYRIHHLDSLPTNDGRLTAVITITSERHGSLGGITKTQTTMSRDVASGLVRSLSEIAWNVKDDQDVLIYTSSAELIADQSSPFPALEVIAD